MAMKFTGSIFYACRGLTSISIPNSVTTIGDEAFWDCSSLTKVNITDMAAWCRINFDTHGNPLHNAKHLYLNDTEVTDLIIPSGVTSIGKGAFDGCKGLKTVVVDNNVKSIGDFAFQWCEGLTSVTIGDNVTHIGQETFSCCSGLTSVTLGNGVTSIGNGAFSNCYSLNSITIPSSIKTIGEHAFYNSVKTICIPKGIKLSHNIFGDYGGNISYY